MKHRGIKIIFSLICVLFLAAVVFFKIEEISDSIIGFKARVFSINLKNTKVDFSQYEPLTDENGAWYENKLIAHACGGIDGKAYTNSKEALELALANGHRVIETDFLLTSDDRVAIEHEWSGSAPTYDEFMASPVSYLYSHLDMESLFSYMMQNKDLYIVTDIKGDESYRKSIFEKLVSYANDNNCQECLDRFIIQIYYESDYNLVKDIYPFPNLIYTLYESGSRDFNRIAEFCLQNDIHVVTMPVSWVDSAERINVFETMNIKVYVNTVNDLGHIMGLWQQTVDGWYTDFIKPNDLNVVGID